MLNIDNAESLGMLKEYLVGGEEHSESNLGTTLSIFVIGEVIFILREEPLLAKGMSMFSYFGSTEDKYYSMT